MPKKTPFLRFFRFCTFLCTFSESRACSSDYVQIFIPFRTNPILYNNLYIFGFCARLPCLPIFALYRNGRGRGICSYFVGILFILGNMIQKTEFVYNCRKKVKKSIAIKKNVVSLQSDSVHLTYSPCGATGTARSKRFPKGVQKRRVFP